MRRKLLSDTLLNMDNECFDTGGGSVYVFFCEGFYKIGVATNVGVRLSTIKTGNPFTIKLLIKRWFLCPYDQELNLHGILSDFRHRGEWFRLSNDAARNLMKEMRRTDVIGPREIRAAAKKARTKTQPANLFCFWKPLGSGP